MNSKSSLSVDWSHDLKGGKAVHLSGIFEKLSYKVRKALFTESAKWSFSSAQCSVKSEGSRIADMHFLIQSFGRDVPVVQPNNSKEGYKNSTSPVAIQEQKEIFLLPTVNVSNLLQSEIHLVLSEMGKGRKCCWTEYITPLVIILKVIIFTLVQIHVLVLVVTTLRIRQNYHVVHLWISMLILPLFTLLLH